MLSCQRSEFELPDHIHYLNCAYMSPQLKSVSEAGTAALLQKGKPWEISTDDFFKGPLKVKQNFSKLVNIEDHRRVAIIPSASYGIATVAANVKLKPGDEILMLAEQFPSNVYSWKRIADEQGGILRMAGSDHTSFKDRNLTENLLGMINERTKVLAIGHNHWADGHLLDLKALRKATRDVGALLVIDGTQSVGALPFDMAEIDPDALICAGYKWLMGPYAVGVAYYGSAFDEGKPIEENWLNRKNSENFQGLVNYQDDYQPMAGRYSMGGQSNFILAPMLAESMQRLLDWGVENIQAYCAALVKEPLDRLQEMGVQLADPACRPAHLLGIRLPDDYFDLAKLKQLLQEASVFVSWRGQAIRISTHVYNTTEDMERLVTCVKDARK